MTHYPKLTDDEAEKLAAHQNGILAASTAFVVCACKKAFHAKDMYQCFYCDVWHCEKCAEEHFGMTKEEWTEKRKENDST